MRVNRIIRLMDLAKLQARHKRRRLSGDAGSRFENHVAPNHLQLEFKASKPSSLKHHSDQGSQYIRDDFQQLLKAHGITCSMSRRGVC